MQHPSKDAIYFLSYPRSGSTWFRYCFAFITETDIDKDILFHSHGTVNDIWSIEDNFDVKSILLLRNYKECIISEMKAVYVCPQESMSQKCAATLNRPLTENLKWLLHSMAAFAEIMKHMAKKFDPEIREFTDDDWESLRNAMNNNPEHTGWQNTAAVSFMSQLNDLGGLLDIESEVCENMADVYRRMKADIDEVFDDFLLPSIPTFDSGPLTPNRHPVESIISEAPPNHYHFALQLIRYYDLLEYHDKIRKENPNNTLLIKYEDFIEDPFSVLSGVIDFMEQASLETSDRISVFRDNLVKFMGDIERHKNISVNNYKVPFFNEGKFVAHSYGQDPEYKFHSSACRKEFLIEVDNVLKNKNLELFNKYLSDYSEKED